MVVTHARPVASTVATTLPKCGPDSLDQVSGSGPTPPRVAQRRATDATAADQVAANASRSGRGMALWTGEQVSWKTIEVTGSG
ncbi:hypothetical protein GCM10027598_65650 [Amycolatopsis oliviviridis]|uniref:Uncharacterized protein n=1 Tax=Amycolatopsis oliviviridis TaxID=1471590 RepID=A0ABQ3MF93_9PSEU|nr:hypothetical protein GCM10017790_79250 [Amycolatopsis oliviviridis]